MPDLLTHVLVGYVLGALLTTRATGFSKAMTTVVMLGALLPDLTKIQLIISDAQMEAALGLPFAWRALHTFGGVLVTASIGSLLVGAANRRRVLVFLLVGAVSHLILDSLLVKPSGYAAPLWWPFITTGFPTPGLYVSYDRWPALIAGTLAAATYLRLHHWPARHRE